MVFIISESEDESSDENVRKLEKYIFIEDTKIKCRIFEKYSVDDCSYLPNKLQNSESVYISPEFVS